MDVRKFRERERERERERVREDEVLLVSKI